MEAEKWALKFKESTASKETRHRSAILHEASYYKIFLPIGIEYLKLQFISL